MTHGPESVSYWLRQLAQTGLQGPLVQELLEYKEVVANNERFLQASVDRNLQHGSYQILIKLSEAETRLAVTSLICRLRDHSSYFQQVDEFGIPDRILTYLESGSLGDGIRREFPEWDEKAKQPGGGYSAWHNQVIIRSIRLDSHDVWAQLLKDGSLPIQIGPLVIHEITHAYHFRAEPWHRKFILPALLATPMALLGYSALATLSQSLAPNNSLPNIAGIHLPNQLVVPFLFACGLYAHESIVRSLGPVTRGRKVDRFMTEIFARVITLNHPCMDSHMSQITAAGEVTAPPYRDSTDRIDTALRTYHELRALRLGRGVKKAEVSMQ